MYHIKNDKRTASSVAKICNGLTVCMRTKRFNEIGISEIARASGVSRATFYRIFDTPHDILEYLCDALVQELLLSNPMKGAPDKDRIALDTIGFLTGHADEITIVFKAGRINLLQKALEPYTERIAPFFAANAPERELDYLKTLLAVSLASVLRVWNLHNREESPEEILRIFKKFNLL